MTRAGRARDPTRSGASCGRGGREAPAGEAGDLVAIAADRTSSTNGACGCGICRRRTGHRQDWRRPGLWRLRLRARFRRRSGRRRRGASRGGFAGDELELPASIDLSQLVVAFGDAQDVVDRLGPFGGDGFVPDQGGEDFAEGIAEVEWRGSAERGRSGGRFRAEPRVGRCARRTRFWRLRGSR